MRIKKFALLAAVAALVTVLALATAGCGDDNDNTTDNNPALSEQADSAKMAEEAEKAESTGAAGAALALAADPDGQLKYDKSSLTGKAGDITIKFTNDSTVAHDVVVTDASDDELGATEQITKSEADLKLTDVKAGTYTFFCSVPGHEQAGMKGTLAVN